MRPEDIDAHLTSAHVMLLDDMRERFPDGTKFLPASEVGRMLKAAMRVGEYHGQIDAYEFRKETEDRIRLDYASWLSKADELEKMG